MARPLLLFVLLWTMALIFLGSYVHATEASLACPDWPTCFGTMMPEMTGGVFWEHLHRLWAGALVLLFAVSVVVLRRGYPERIWLFRLGLAGIAALLAQSLLGGLTVLLRLPDAISAAHLAMALVFVALLATLLARTGRDPVPQSTGEAESGGCPSGWGCWRRSSSTRSRWSVPGCATGTRGWPVRTGRSA